MALCSLIAAWAWLDAVCFAQNLEREFEFEIREEKLGDAIEKIVQETDFLILFPYELADERGVNPVIGQYTVKEALDVLFRDTKFSGGLTESGVMYISLSGHGNAQDPEGEMASGKMKKSLLAGVATFLFGAGGASAQDGEAAPASERVRSDEIVVTALRREQGVQDVPAGIDVLTPGDLDAQAAQDYRDYLSTIPGVTFTEGNLGGARVTIRGVADANFRADPLSTIYIDETPITEVFVSTFDPNLYDIERVEVLKGPQGTLYGSGAMGGTVRIITKQPQLNEFSAVADGRFGAISHGGSSKRGDVVVNVPLVEDRLAFRIAATHRNDGGWIDNTLTGKEDVNSIEKTSFHARLLYQLGEDTSITAGVLYQNDDNGLTPIDDIGGFDYEVAQALEGYSRGDSHLYTLTLNHEWDGASLISATNYLSRDQSHSTDATPPLSGLIAFFTGVTIGADEGLGVLTPSDLNLFTQEVRLSSNSGGRLEWLVGGFYSDQSVEIPQTFDFSQAPSLDGVVMGEEFFLFNQQFGAQQIAIFGELGLKIADNLKLTAGLRQAYIEQLNTVVNDGILNGGQTITQDTYETNPLTQKYALEFKPAADNLLYVQAAQGFRNGGPNGFVPLAACGADLAAAGYDSVPDEFSPDKLWNYEVGSKNTLFDGRMTLNAAAFYIDWDEIQTTVSLACGFGFAVNSGKVASKGVEVESILRPIDGLSLGASFSFVDSTLEEAASGAQAAAGDKVPLTAKWSGNASVTYERPIAANLTGFVNANASYVGDRWTLFESAPNARLLDDYFLANASVGVEWEHLAVSVFASNIFDERHVISGLVRHDIVGRPRTVGVRLRVSR